MRVSCRNTMENPPAQSKESTQPLRRPSFHPMGFNGGILSCFTWRVREGACVESMWCQWYQQCCIPASSVARAIVPLVQGSTLPGRSPSLLEQGPHWWRWGCNLQCCIFFPEPWVFSRWHSWSLSMMGLRSLQTSVSQWSSQCPKAHGLSKGPQSSQCTRQRATTLPLTQGQAAEGVGFEKFLKDHLCFFCLFVFWLIPIKICCRHNTTCGIEYDNCTDRQKLSYAQTKDSVWIRCHKYSQWFLLTLNMK